MIFEIIVLLVLILIGFFFFIKKPTTTTTSAPSAPSTTTQHEQLPSEFVKPTENIQTQKQIPETVPEQFVQKEEKESIKEAPEVLKAASVLEEVQPLLEDRPIDFSKSDVRLTPLIIETKEQEEVKPTTPEVLDEKVDQKEEMSKIPLEVEEKTPVLEKVFNPFETFAETKNEQEVEEAQAIGQEKFNQEVRLVPEDVKIQTYQEEIKPVPETIQEETIQTEVKERSEQALENQEEVTAVHKDEVNPFEEDVRKAEDKNIAYQEYHLLGDKPEHENLNDIPEAFVEQVQEEEIKPISEILPVPKEPIQKEEVEPSKISLEQSAYEVILEPISESLKDKIGHPEATSEERTEAHKEGKSLFETQYILTPEEAYERRELEQQQQQETEVMEPVDFDKTVKGRDLNRQPSAKTTMKKGFNFRANRSKVESILKKENSLSQEQSVSRANVPLDSSLDNNTILSALESTVDLSNSQTLQEKSDEKDLSVREENILKVEEEPQIKKRGFNFKNPKRKSITEKTEKVDKSSVSSSQELQLTENTDPALQETLKPSALGESGKVEVKKSKGFNFRNTGRIKAE